MSVYVRWGMILEVDYVIFIVWFILFVEEVVECNFVKGCCWGEGGNVVV